MAGQIFQHFNLFATGEEVVTGSLLNIRVPNLPKKIHFVKASLQSVDTGAEAAAALTVTEVIAADGKSFSLYVWDEAGAASAVAVTVKWLAIIE